MPRLGVEQLRELGTAILNALGSPPERSAWVAETLLRANLAGHDSHGIMRLLQYAEFAREGYIDLSAEVVTLRETGATALLDARRTWGQVAAKIADGAGDSDRGAAGHQHGGAGELPAYRAAWRIRRHGG